MPLGYAERDATLNPKVNEMHRLGLRIAVSAVQGYGLFKCSGLIQNTTEPICDDVKGFRVRLK